MRNYTIVLEIDEHENSITHHTLCKLHSWCHLAKSDIINVSVALTNLFTLIDNRAPKKLLIGSKGKSLPWLQDEGGDETKYRDLTLQLSQWELLGTYRLTYFYWTLKQVSHTRVVSTVDYQWALSINPSMSNVKPAVSTNKNCTLLNLLQCGLLYTGRSTHIMDPGQMPCLRE